MYVRPIVIALAFFSVAGLPYGAEKTATPPSSGGAVVAEVDGVKLTRADLNRKKGAALTQPRNALYEAERKAVEELIDEQLLAGQAAKEGLSVDNLLAKHVNVAIAKEPSEEALRVYYDGLDVAEPFEAVRGKIADTVRERRTAKARTAYVAALRAQAKVALMLSVPRAHIALEHVPLRGRSDAPVKVIEFSDYECPYCQQIQPAVAKLEQDFKGRIAFGYKDVPLPMHASAQKASEAAHCAGLQGKYWEYHDRLFATKQLDLPRLKDHARALGLDGASFDVCLDTGKQADVVKRHLSDAQAMGLPGTPGFFVNGRFLSGTVDYQILRKAVEDELGSIQ